MPKSRVTPFCKERPYFQLLSHEWEEGRLKREGVYKESACNAGNLGLIPGLRRSPGEGNGNLLHYSYLENSMDRGAWWTTVHRVAKSQDMTEQLTLSLFFFHG